MCFIVDIGINKHLFLPVPNIFLFIYITIYCAVPGVESQWILKFKKTLSFI